MSDQQRLFHYERIIDEQATKLNETAAFLDALAARFLDTRPRGWDEIERAAADCRAMAKTLRSEKQNPYGEGDPAEIDGT